jgi:hypothetical protein
VGIKNTLFITIGTLILAILLSFLTRAVFKFFEIVNLFYYR